jgi:SAM-dependent methyltransferase
MTEANKDQAAFWNADAGQCWTRFHADLDAMHAEVTALLMATCAARPGESVLDIGSGAGGSTFELARAVGPEGQVLGLDISAPLVTEAREIAAASGVSNARFDLGDAQDMALPRAAFDLAASRFGVMFFADPLAAFRNIATALKTGGRFVFVAWAGPEHNPWFATPGRIAQARLGALPPSPPEAPGPMAFRDADRVVGLLGAAGFEEARAEPVDLHLVLPGGIPAALNLLRHIGPIPGVIRAHGGTEEDVQAIHAEVAEAFAAYAGRDGLALPARVACFSAHRPA